MLTRAVLAMESRFPARQWLSGTTGRLHSQRQFIGVLRVNTGGQKCKRNGVTFLGEAQLGLLDERLRRGLESAVWCPAGAWRRSW